MPVPIHNHTEYSNLDGYSRPSEIAERCKELGYSACGITDHGVVSGHLEFAKALNGTGIKPIFGCEIYQGTKWSGFKQNERDQPHLIVIAKNNKGLRNLWCLLDTAARAEQFHHVGRNTWDDLAKYKDGLICTSACIASLVSQGVLKEDYTALNKCLDIFGENFFIELHTYDSDEQRELNERYQEIGIERGIPFVYADDAHFARPDQYEIHDVYIAKQTGESVYTPIEERKMWHPPTSLYIKDIKEIQDALGNLNDNVVEEAIKNTEDIANIVDAQLPEVRRHLPTFIASECPWIDKKDWKKDAAEIFTDLVEEGIVDRYGEDADPEIWERAIKEMEVFLDAGLEHYFLLAWDLCRFADDSGIERGPGRGSSAGCLVAYALHITDVDPLRYGLIFERFYNAGREKGLPDIDSDFQKSRRKEILGYLMRRHGAKKVRSIGNVGRLKPIAAINRFYNACDIEFREKEELKKIIEQTPDIEILGPDSIGWDADVDPGKSIYVAHSTENAEHDTGEKIEKWISADSEREDLRSAFVEIIRNICNRVEGYGVHASGIVISDVELADELPSRWAADPKIPVTQFNMDEVDKRQFVKLDVLGLKTLDTLADWKDQMEEQGFEIDWSGLEAQEHEEEMWKLLDNGFATGVFQIERGYPKRLCEDMKVRGVEDLAVVTALNRPGPIRAKVPEKYIRRRQGKEEITTYHPILEDILEPTLGLFLYQEEVIAYFTRLGYTPSEADAVRKILGKKQPEKWDALKYGRQEWKDRGYKEMAKATIDEETLETIWDDIVDFAKYSFNKSHSICYGTIGFRTLFAKYYGPAEFYIAGIRTLPKEEKLKRVHEFVNEARRYGLDILPPDIGRSQARIATDEGDIVFGFSDVKGVGYESGKYLVKLRDELEVDVNTPENLFKWMEEEKKRMTKNRKKGEKLKEKTPKQQLQENKITALFTAGAWDGLGERHISLTDKQLCEKELLGVIISDNSDTAFNEYQDHLEECDTYRDVLDSEETEVKFEVPGIISEVRETRTKAANKAMGIVTIEWGSDELEFVVFPHQWKGYKRFLFKDRVAGFFTLKKTDRGINFEEGIKV